MPVDEAVHSRWFLPYLTLLVAAAGVALWSAGPPGFDPTLALAALVLLILAETGAVSVRGGGSHSVALAIQLAAVIVLGPVTAAYAAATATLAARVLLRRSAVSGWLADAAAAALASLAAGSLFASAGGRFGAMALPQDLLAGLLAAAGLFGVHSLLASLTLGLTAAPHPVAAWQRLYARSLPFHLSCLALGALIALTALNAGSWALLLVAPPLLAVHGALRFDLGLRGDLKDFVRALAGVLDEVDPYTRQHSVRVAEYSRRLGRGLGCSERELEDLEYAALVHDLGKIGPQHQRILQKAGTLTHEDQRTLRSHPATGAGIVGKVGALRRAADIVRLHHERPDGRGYPLGLRSDQVPLGARILNVADAFDAMTSDRPYRRALDVETAVRELDRGAGTQFDREVVDCLLVLHAKGRFPKIESPSSEELLLLRTGPRRVRV